MRDYAVKARAAARVLRTMHTRKKNEVLRAIATAVREARTPIELANAEDVAADLPRSVRERLLLDVEAAATRVTEIAALRDPVGRSPKREAAAGFSVTRKRVPLGVILFIYESNPWVTLEAAALCFKSGNAVILKGGSEAMRTNTALVAAIESVVPDGAVQLVTGGHDDVAALLDMDALIDLVIPRGDEALVRSVTAKTRIPVLRQSRGNCHVYVDAAADLDMAERIVVNAKCDRPAACNAAEKVLVHADVAEAFVPRLAKLGVELRGDQRARAILEMTAARSEDWYEEYLDRILAVRIVDSVDAAVDHIEKYGSHHTDVIVTSEDSTAHRFLEEVDSATVLWNASTRLADGHELGLGAELGVSTGKLHARGPMGLEELTTYKWVVEGDGHLRE